MEKVRRANDSKCDIPFWEPYRMYRLSLRDPASAWISRDNHRAHGHHKRDVLHFPTSKFLPSCIVTSAFIPFLPSLLYLFVIRRRTWTRNRSSTSDTNTTGSSWPVAYRRGGGVLNPSPPPKFRSFDKVEPDCKLSGKCLVFLFQHPN
jgi:hypothetical protein